MIHIVDFQVANLHMGINLFSVERVIYATAITPLPGLNHGIAGVINVHGKICSVFSLRNLFSLEEREMNLEDKIILCNLNQRKIGLWVDKVMDTFSLSDEELIAVNEALPNVEYIDRVIRRNDQFILMYDWQKLLKLESNLVKA